MKALGFAVTMGVGAVVGAVAILTMPRQNVTRRLADKAAANVEDAVMQMTGRLTG